ncbi:MAG: hypothetical protein FWD23_03310 [Oscillospiraceae bacterium]|nr:hypothetical protein [Oscillospiraceae bacterium]
MQNKNITRKIINEFTAISETENPGGDVLEKIINNLDKEKSVIMKKTAIRRSFGTVAVAAIILMIITTTAFAAWHLLNPSEIAEKLGHSTLSAAFESENAININASQTAGGYIFTLMSIVSGSDITDYRTFDSAGLQRERTYAVVAVQKADGSPFSEEELMEQGHGFYISPYVRGIPPFKLNSHILGGGGQATIIDGVKYLLTECDDISMFADKGVYIGISEGFMFGNAFIFNEETGELTPNPESDGVSVIFDLPLDISLADPVRAQQYLDDFWGD